MPATILPAFSPEPVRRSAVWPETFALAEGSCLSLSFRLVLAGQGRHREPEH